MTAIWCIAAYYLVNHPLIASKNTPHWPYRFTFCPHWARYIHFG
jgi:hypothetical protein